jgi:CRISPR-associated protein Cas2
MERRRYLVAYDIRQDGRLRRVHALMKEFGYPLQYSVFLCDLDALEKAKLKVRLGETISERVDSIAIVDLGEATRRGMECFEFMGPSRGLPTAESRIV